MGFNQARNPWAVLLSIFFLCGLLSCSQSDSASNDEGQLFIKLLDAPAAYQQLNIVVDRVSIHRAGASSEVGWTVVSIDPTPPINLLNLRNGISEKLVLNTVSVGSYDQIKIRFGFCTIVDNGPQAPLQFDSTLQLGKIVQYAFTVEQGEQSQITFDFDVYQSIKKNGTSYYFNPVIRVQNTLLSGSILGSVVDSLNIPVPATISTSTGLDQVSTSNDVNSGSFQLSDLPEGVYSITVASNDSLYLVTTISNLSVIRQKQTSVGVIHLHRK